MHFFLDIEEIIKHHGPFGIFFLLALGVMGMPLPDEPFLALSGYLINIGESTYLPMATAAFMGSMLGISISYTIGHFPITQIIEKHGTWIRLSPARFTEISSWFKLKGDWILIFGYFIPGVRHIIAILAGSAHMRFSRFLIFASIGALLWTNTFLLLGYIAGNEWQKALLYLHNPYLLMATILLVLLFTYRSLSKKFAEKPDIKNLG